MFERIDDAGIAFGGALGSRIGATVEHWLLPLPVANPGLLQAFRERERTDRRPSWYLLPWSGEFAGKYLIGGSQFTRLTRDPRLRRTLGEFAAGLIACQDADGYLGVYEPGRRLADSAGTWDLWNQYHCMLGLYEWYTVSQEPATLAACRRAADLICRTYVDGGRSVDEAGSPAQNRSAAHVFALLHRLTGEARYGTMVETLQAGYGWDSPFGARWEAMHALQARAELYLASGDAAQLGELERIWWRLVAEERHCNGGWGAKEEAGHDPYSPLPIETCATVAWVALCVDMLRVTGDSRVADELELATWNAVLGSQEPGARWWTYDTPMGGSDVAGQKNMELPPPLFGPPRFLAERRPTAVDLGWQEREGTPQLSCCSANGPRGLGALADWAVMAAQGTLVVNFYGACTFDVRTPRGQPLRLEQRTKYPVGGSIRLLVRQESPERFMLRLRIPGWARRARVLVNDQAVAAASPGSYATIEREWRGEDVVDLDLEMAPRLWVGERSAHGRMAIYHGPLLMAHDRRFDARDAEALPRIDPRRAPRVVADDRAMLVLDYDAEGGQTVRLCDYASAGGAVQPPGSPGDPSHSVWRFGASNGVAPPPVRLGLDGNIDGYHFDDLRKWRADGDGVATIDASRRESFSLPNRFTAQGRAVLRSENVLHREDNDFRPGATVTALVPTFGLIGLYVLGTDDRVWMNTYPWWDRPGQWLGWVDWIARDEIGGDRHFPDTQTISAVSTRPGGTSLFAVGPEDKVWSRYWPEGDRRDAPWSRWFALGDNVFPKGASVTALSTRYGGTSLYVQGIDDKVWTNYFPAPVNPDRWTGWFALSEETFPKGTTITAVSTRPGATSLFAIGPDDKVWSKYWPERNTTNWSGWFTLGDNVFPKGASVTAISPEPGCTQLYLLGLDGRVWTAYFPDGPFGRWSAWHQLGAVPHDLREHDADWVRGSPTISWLPAPLGLAAAPFSPQNVLRAVWP